MLMFYLFIIYLLFMHQKPIFYLQKKIYWSRFCKNNEYQQIKKLYFEYFLLLIHWYKENTSFWWTGYALYHGCCFWSTSLIMEILDWNSFMRYKVICWHWTGYWKFSTFSKKFKRKQAQLDTRDLFFI